ncbi:MAG TPA: hypothetical protein VD813_15565, partial [Pseudonocardia sp.]|nr:hypothetical protein [Pseudonocardia sp.]
ALVGLGVWAGQSAPASAVAGDCVARVGDDDLRIVDCGGGEAEFRVVGRLEDRTAADAGAFACTEFPEATNVFWQGEPDPGATGFVLCLAPPA